MKKLPTGLQVFEHIRRDGALYVDKTDMIYNIVSDPRRQYFISRPRRFGKTLLCWTLNALFSGKRELFEGLAISKTDWAWESYPIIHLDMSKVGTSEGVDGVRRSLAFQMKYIASEHEVSLDEEMGIGEMLTKTIIETSKKHGKHAVVIVDEYDKPFLDFFTDPVMAEEVRNILRDCYVQLKANEPHMRFLFMTGISKFTKAGVFSKLNNLNDLSLDRKFSTLFGYTQEELVDYFAEHLEAGAKDHGITVEELVTKLRNYYNGFSFDGIHKVYNPFSVLCFFQDYQLSNYWIQSGGTKVIADYMKSRHLTVEQFRNVPVTRDFANSPGDIDTSPPENFFYQAGYLTLRDPDVDSFTLDYPNTEVLNSMSLLVAQNIIQHGGAEFMDLRNPLMTALVSGKSERIIETINRLLASIPYDDYVGAAKQALSYSDVEITTQEWLYRSTILAFLRGCGILAFGEMHNNQGRSDLLVIHRNVPWIIEIKVARDGDNDAKAEEAMAQINGRQYDAPYQSAKKLAIAIDDKTRQIEKWIVL
ncbi:MAG: ATP-binding protein [Chitinispirillales bacterium]|jgi:hypothetical protein|nr:ATP-binding protein [Chitinispirillales bacterium]